MTQALDAAFDASPADRAAKGARRVEDGQERLFRVTDSIVPSGDQPEALRQLEEQLRAGNDHVVLAGATGTGKSATTAFLIEKMNRPALVMAPNKTLAAQLAAELRELLPGAAVEYFVSYYDYYQPEAYIAQSDTYIEKDSAINQEVDRARHAATAALLTRRDVVVVASVSCIYGLGSPKEYLERSLVVEKGGTWDLEALTRQLVGMQYTRNDLALTSGTFRVRGDTMEIAPISQEHIVRIELFGDEVEELTLREPLTQNIVARPRLIVIPPATHHLASPEAAESALGTIRTELEARVLEFQNQGKLLEAQRIRMRTENDLEMLRETGSCSGVENYSRHFDRREPGSAPYTLLDYFAQSGEFLTVLDESHVTVPQIGAMHEGDASRKRQLIEYGFRLPSALDNRPLRFDEFEERVGQTVYLSATPGKFELAEVEKEGLSVVDQIIRPTHLIDPTVEVRPTAGQIDDLLVEIGKRTDAGERVLVTVLTKAMAEKLTEYLTEAGVKVRYLHSDVDTLMRIELLRDLRRGVFDVLVGINLLREGLDLPEVSLVAILDADKQGFLRSATSLIQTIGRAARNLNGHVIMYADQYTPAMTMAIDETNRRRGIQVAHNTKHGLEPKALVKKLATVLNELREEEEAVSKAPQSKVKRGEHRGAGALKAALEHEAEQLEARMREAAKGLRFEEAAAIRDELRTVQSELRELSGQ